MRHFPTEPYQTITSTTEKDYKNYDSLSSYYAHTDPIFKDFNIITIDKLVVHRIGIAMYKINNEMYPSGFNDLYKKIMMYILITREQKICSLFH